MKDDVTGNVLDLGCGIGVIGISLDLYKKGLDITYSDVNERCLTLVEKNLKHLGLEGEVVKSDGFEQIPDVYDTIVTNPPISAGLDTCFDLIRNAHDHLEDGGRLFVVAKHTKGGERLQKEMRKVFGNNAIKSSKKGFKVYTSWKR